MNFISIINWVRKKYPEKEAIIENSESINYQEFWEKINAACRCYLDLNVNPGDRILIILPNSMNFMVYHYAALKIGAVSVPVKTEYKFKELTAICENCRPKLLISCSDWLNVNVTTLQNAYPEIRFIAVDKLQFKHDENDIPISPVGNDDIASINYSYFGDGYPKGATLTHGNHIYAATGYSKFQGFSLDDRFLIILPMSHVYTLSGCLNTSQVVGGTIVIENSFSPKSIFSAIENHKITILTAIPAIFEYLAKFIRKDKYDLSSLRLCITGGDFLPENLQQKYEKMLDRQIIQGYGLTESLPLICNPPGPRNVHGTLGMPGRKDIEIKIVDEKNEQKPVNQIGEILIKSPTNMIGYFNLPDDTKKILKDGWLYTGDIGMIDQKGYLHFCGLKKKIFNMYGNKIDSLEVKNLLLEHPLIENANVYLELLSEDEYIIGSKRICADIYVRNGNDVSSDQIKNYCKEMIANYKVPDRFNIIRV